MKHSAYLMNSKNKSIKRKKGKTKQTRMDYLQHMDYLIKIRKRNWGSRN